MTMTPGQKDLIVYRNQPNLIAFDVIGLDWSAAVFAMQVRSTRGLTNTALLDLVIATAGTQGISRTVATTDGVPTTTVTIQIDETALDAVAPYPANGLAPNTPVELRYDIAVTPSGSAKRRLVEGAFTIVEGVTL
jgi:hypothetical protein